MKEICSKLDCTGCMACAFICPHHAISFESVCGFMYPKINSEKCTSCGVCRKKCPQNNDLRQNHQIHNSFLSFDKNSNSRIESSSGGIFSVISKKILSLGGVVCGCAYDSNMKPHHVLVDNDCELEKLKGSKYVQSEIGDCYEEIKSLIHQGRWVYFVGTPCQVAGLYSYLGKDFDHLLTSDLICHGVPSATSFQHQIKSFEKKYDDSICDFKFRSKDRFGWGYDCELLFRSGRHKYLCAETIPYFYGFWKNLTLRESCYRCKYASKNRMGDITLADFWTAKKLNPKMKVSKGVSLVLTNSLKGNVFWEKVKDELFFQEINLEITLKSQSHLSVPVERPHIRDYYTGELNLRIPLTYRLTMHVRNVVKLLLFYKYWK